LRNRLARVRLKDDERILRTVEDSSARVVRATVSRIAASTISMKRSSFVGK
jgi:hypothetical protein